MDIIWSDELKTGIPVIDEQHQFIVESLSGIQVSKLTKAELFRLLTKLQAYLSVHFDVEEDYMIDANYPGYETHKANHDKVLEDCKNILAQNVKDNSTSEVALEFTSYMKNWFLDHYSNEDLKMVDYLKKHIEKNK